jgi:hypothetical protein
MHQLKTEFDKGKESRQSKESNQLGYQVTKAKKAGDMVLVKKLARARLQIP